MPLYDESSLIPGAPNYGTPPGYVPGPPPAPPVYSADPSLVPQRPSIPAPPRNPYQLELTPLADLPRQPGAPQPMPGLSPLAPTPGQLILPGTPFQLDSGWSSVPASTAAGLTANQKDRITRDSMPSADSPWGAIGRAFNGTPAPGAPPAGAAAGGTPAQPSAVAPGAVVTGGPAGGGGGSAPPALSAEQMAKMTPAEIELYNYNRARVAAEMSKRPSAGVLVRGGKVQTGESTAGQVGASPETTARYNAARAATADLAGQQAGVEAQVAEEARQANARRAGIEAVDAQRAEELEKRRVEAMKAATETVETAQREVAEGKYEPDRVWNHASTGEKALTFLGAILSGIGQSAAGQGQSENLVFKGLRETLDRDNINQQQVLKLKGEKLNAAQRAYKDTLERFGSERAAQSAAKLVKLNALDAQLAAKAEGMRASAMARGERVVGADGKVYEGPSVVTLREAQARAMLEEERAREQFNLEREINGTVNRSYGFTQDRRVGGSAGPDAKAIHGALRENADIERGAVPKGGSRADQPGVLVVNGQPLPIAPGVSSTATDKAQERIAMADQGLAILAEARKRGATPGGIIPGDPAIGLQGGLLSGLAAQLTGSGVPSPSQERVVAEALTPGPRQEAALQALEGIFRSGKQVYIGSVGAAR